MAHPEYKERVVLSTKRLNEDHPIGPLIPVGRFDWERMLNHCTFKPSSVKLLGLTMATFADLETGTRIYPGNKRIGAITTLSRSTVERGIETLESAGFLYRVSSGSSSGRAAKASEYRLTAPEIFAEEYRDEMNSGAWHQKEYWEPGAMWNMTEVLKHVAPVTHVSKDHASPVTHDLQSETKEHASISKEHASIFEEHASPVNRTCVTSDAPRVYRSNQSSSNQSNESAANHFSDASLEGRKSKIALLDETQKLTEAEERNRQAAALQKLIAEEQRHSA